MALGAFIVVLGLIFLAQHSGLFVSSHSQQTSQVSSPTTKEPEVKKPVILTLPGVAPITALLQDYNSPTSQWVVVSKDHPLPDDHYTPAAITVPNVPLNTQKTTAENSVNTQTALAVEQLFADAKQNGFDFMIASGYRSYDLQATYFNSYAANYGRDAANQFSALPGQSEHQTGFALDISLTSRECYLDTCFGDMDAGKWLAAHAVDYGFILRYPAEKTGITKYQYEPWHFRYVGKELASALKQVNLTLDEAYPYLQATLTELKQRGDI